MLASRSIDEEKGRTFIGIKLWNVSTGAELRSLKAHSGPVEEDLAFSPDGQIVASTGNDDKIIELWSLATGSEVRTLRGHRVALMALAFSPDGNILASSSYGDQTILWNVSTGAELHTLKEFGELVFSPDGKVLAIVSHAVIRLCDVSTGTVLRTLKGRQP